MATASRRWILLSPHPDDAAFSAWHVLTSDDDVHVVTVFAGIPPEGALSPLDRSGGASSSAERMRVRLADDIAALARTGRTPKHVNLLDVQYRADRTPHLRAAIERDPRHFVSLVASEESIRMPIGRLQDALGDILRDDGAGLYVPTGIGDHPDHRDVGRLGAALADTGREVRLYADMPYIIRHGFPKLISGQANPPADALVESAFFALFGTSRSLEHHVVELDPAEVSRKIETLKRYETEFNAANEDFGGILTNPEMMRFEVYWALFPAHVDW